MAVCPISCHFRATLSHFRAISCHFVPFWTTFVLLCPTLPARHVGVPSFDSGPGRQCQKNSLSEFTMPAYRRPQASRRRGQFQIAKEQQYIVRSNPPHGYVQSFPRGATAAPPHWPGCIEHIAPLYLRERAGGEGSGFPTPSRRGRVRALGGPLKTIGGWQ